MEALDQHPVGDRRGVAYVLDLLDAETERLFAEHVLAGPQSSEIPAGVQRVDQAVVDQLDLGVGEQLGIGGVHSLDAMLGRECPSPLGVPRRHRDEPVAAGLGRLDDGLAGDPGGAEDTDPQRAAHPVTRTVPPDPAASTTASSTRRL